MVASLAKGSIVSVSCLAKKALRKGPHFELCLAGEGLTGEG